jgi:hypothetical protein
MKYNFSRATKKIMDSFFRTIAKTGTLVSLDRFIWVTKADDTGDIISRVQKPSPLLSLSRLITKLGFRLIGACFTGKLKYLSRIRQLDAFRLHIYNMRRHHGSPYVVKYLKFSQLAIQKAIAGTPVSSLRELEPALMFPYLSAGGLPKFIPVRDRRLMLLNGSSSVIRWWLTLYSIYRVISIPGVLKLSTITDPLTVKESDVLEVADSIKKLIDPSMFDLTLLRRQARFLFIEKASATTKLSWMGFLSDALALKASGQMEPLIRFLGLIGNYDLIRVLVYIYEGLRAHHNAFGLTTDLYLSEVIKGSPVGRLGTKDEAAGKVRVFAMVDVWTQSALRPLHDVLFAFLRTLPNDATFDQDASVMRCQAKVATSSKSFGYDLSAATDRLPIILQMEIIDALVPGLGPVWREVLVGRGYALKGHGVLHYSVGQPMGALSSWAMLAVTHHYIAQLAALQARAESNTISSFWDLGVDDSSARLPVPWYVGYEVLGDDIVFFEEDVGIKYLAIMAKIGVPINTTKSVMATNQSFEFAKVTGHRGQNVSAVSWAMFMSQPSLMGRAGIGYAMLRKQIVRTRVISWLTRLSRESKYTQGSPNVFFLALGTMYAKAGRLPFFDFLYSIMQRSAGAFNVYQTLLEKANISTLQRAITDLVAVPVGVVEVKNPLEKRRGWKAEEFELKQTLVTTLNAFLHGSIIDGKTVNALNPAKDAALLARSILLAPSIHLSITDVDVLDHKKVFTLDKRALKALDSREAFIHHLFIFLYVQIYDQLIMLYTDISSSSADFLGLSLEELLALVDKVDRYKEVLALLVRANKKLAGELPPDRNLMESPLKVLEFLLFEGDPFGPPQDGSPAAVSFGQSAFEYMYALERLENLPITDNLLLGEADPASAYLSSYGPVYSF